MDTAELRRRNRKVASQMTKAGVDLAALVTEQQRLQAENRQLKDKIERLQEEAYLDDLTGLWSKKSLRKLATDSVATLQRQDNPPPFILAILDLNKFKDINDNYGHTVGNHALLALSQALQTRIGREAIAARWGGDEFVIWMPLHPDEQPETAIDEVMGRVEKQANENLQNDPYLDDPEVKSKLRISLSFGTGLFQGKPGKESPAEILEALFVEADQKMYEMKKGKKS